MASVTKPIRWLYNEFGLASVYHTGRDAWLIILGRGVRMFAYGGTSLIIALFFNILDFSDSRIGLFMTLTLLGDLILSLFLTLVSDKVGRRRVLFGGSLLMILSGAVFAYFENFWILLSAAVIGVISATGSDFGPFRAIEESTIAHLTTPKTRSDVMSWYIAVSILGSAAGNEFAGRLVEYLQRLEGWDLRYAYHAVFGLYITMGVICTVLILLLTDKCELKESIPESEATEGLLNEQRLSVEERRETEADPRSVRPTAVESQDSHTSKSRFSRISAETRPVMYKLWFLLCIDSLADGMVGLSLTNYYVDQKFHLSKATLGDIMSASYFIASWSTIFAGPLARHLGLIRTMVFTHLPSSAAVLLFPIPQGVPLTAILLFIRMGLNNMDQAPRATFIAAVTKPDERTAANGITSMLRTLASTAGPSVTGLLAGNDRFWIAFVTAGALRIIYDLGLFAMFVNMKLNTHEPNDEPDSENADPRRRSSDEEEMAELQPLGQEDGRNLKPDEGQT